MELKVAYMEFSCSIQGLAGSRPSKVHTLPDHPRPATWALTFDVKYKLGITPLTYPQLEKNVQLKGNLNMKILCTDDTSI